ncbi:hypothetical protein E1B28_006249 [Marasmius oreades]|uniref:Uncharacterized protein n=1 Tax=Marasmius oreades TaxID=181124 RepID=A0A9P7UVL9_9AGAR|nr:uncharacterized protein E1B28_006249 [Marasmius oreades]KAG7095510.1 hypothetical protein E1B28_006249 [Marasmius oreades]
MASAVRRCYVEAHKGTAAPPATRPGPRTSSLHFWGSTGSIKGGGIMVRQLTSPAFCRQSQSNQRDNKDSLNGPQQSVNMGDRNPIMNKIVEWGNANGEKIEQAYSFNGGWEGWVQVELAIAFKRAFEGPGSTVTVTREDLVYQGNNQRSDILFTTRRGAERFTNMLELKCETSRAGGAAAFAAAVQADCAKVNNGLINNQFTPCKAWVIAFSVTRNLTNLTVGVDQNNQPRHLRAYPDTIRAGGRTITLYYGWRDFA